jgi:hypothetical protein
VKSPQLPLMVILTSIVLILTLLGFFVRNDATLGIQWILIRWAVIIAAFAALLGLLNVLMVHVARLASRASGWPYSLALILSVVAVLAVGLGELIFRPEEGLWGPLMAPQFTWVVVPLQAAAAALLPFILTYAAFRMVGSRQKGALIFLVSALIVLIGQLPLSGLNGELLDLREIWLSWLAIPGLRAVVIGVALGIGMVTLRLMLGVDRPQG